MTPPINLRVLIAVDNVSEGYILDWHGEDGMREAFSLEVENGGRHCDDVLLDWPPQPGLWQFNGRMHYYGEGEESEPVYEGDWTPLYMLPALAIPDDERGAAVESFVRLFPNSPGKVDARMAEWERERVKEGRAP